MYSHSFRSKVVSGSFTLPVMAIATLLLWPARGAFDWTMWVGLLLTGCTTYVVMELNNRFALLRIRSRLVSSTYLLFMAVMPALHAWHPRQLCTLCFALSYAMLFSVYQRVRAEGYVFHAFLFMGAGSMLFPPMLVLAFLFYFSLIFQLRNFGWRIFMAGLLGLLVPYWFRLAYALTTHTLATSFDFLLAYTRYEVPDYGSVSWLQWTNVGVVGLLGWLGLCHFLRTAYNDKIRTRMLFYVVVTQQLALTAGVALLPAHLDVLFALLILNSSLLAGHYYAVGKGRFFDAWFNVSLLLVVALGVVNYVF